MNILADENISRLIVERLRHEKHQVQYIFEMARGSDDSTVLEIANQQKALLVTSDKDFGELIFRQNRQASGVLLVRLAVLSPTEEAEVVALVIRKYGDRLLDALTVITPRGVRIHPV
jgi:predicted nuclease of predicted toxin-antitoxin system